jgi:hypothetical protein
LIKYEKYRLKFGIFNLFGNPWELYGEAKSISLTFSNTSTVGTDLRAYDAGGAPNITSVGSNFSNANAIQFDSTASSGGLTTGRAVTILWANSITGGYIWVSAEL